MAACASASSDAPPDHHEDGESEGTIDEVESPLSPNDSVATAVAQSCTTTAVKGLALQLVAEIQCLRPGTLKSIENTNGLALGAAVFPYLQTAAATHLVTVQKARGVTMSINSALRTLPQQYLLYRWYKTGRCGIGLAASPGTSNHEGAIAVDVNDNAGWRSAMTSNGFRWLGASDPVHYDFVGGGTVDLRGLSVRAFQRLWNRNHPTDTIVVDGDYGPSTEQRLAASPSGGFAKGADCTDLKDAGADASPDADVPPNDVPVVPDADEPTPSSSKTTAAALPTAADPSPAATGCSASPRAVSAGAAPGLLALLAVLAVLLARRARPPAAPRP